MDVLLTAFLAALLAEFGDKTQFLRAALAAQFDSLLLAAPGATAGVVAASLPAVILAERMPEVLPLKPIRIGIASLFLLVGFIVAASALRLA